MAGGNVLMLSPAARLTYQKKAAGLTDGLNTAGLDNAIPKNSGDSNQKD
jgi:hypothetical protein